MSSFPPNSSSPRPSDDADAPRPRRASRATPTPASRSPRILIVSASPDRRESLTRALRAEDAVCGLADSPAAAYDMLGPAARATPRFEVVLLDLPKCSSQALRFVRDLGDRRVSTVLVCPDVSFDEAVQAMRAGACDIVSGAVRPRELCKRVRSAVAQHRSGVAAHTDAALADTLPPADTLRPAAQPRSAQNLIAGSIPGTADPDAASTPASLARASRINPQADDDRPDPVDALARLIHNELDVESLLRHALEFILAEGGPTNAAVFLPGQSGDYSLGAYVNLSCPKDTAEVLLEHLANVAAPRLEATHGILRLSDPDSIELHTGVTSDWLTDSHVVAFSCKCDDEVLAVFMLFRDASTPFSRQLIATLTRLSEVFARQLARVVRIHHRHLPREQWGSTPPHLGGSGPSPDGEGSDLDDFAGPGGPGGLAA